MNPYKILEPTVISFSGGRTSGYMLWRIIQENNGIPEGSVVTFANTGKEEEETLKFVKACQDNWNVDIHWIEYQYAEKPADRWKKVDFETASRNGEPFEAMINDKKMLPNNFMRFCTAELKINTIRKYLKSIELNIEDDSHLVGIRADEPRRAAKISRDRTPLVVAGVGKEEIGLFWKNQPFDLQLPNFNGVTYHGNCDLCFLKGESQTRSLIAEKPERAVWWAKMEALALASKPSGARFRTDRPSYAEMMEFAKNQTDMFGNDESIACFCGD